MRKKVFVIFVLAVGIIIAQQAGAGEQLYDWAWSDNIGWVSFRNDNTNAHWIQVEEDDGLIVSQPNNASDRRDMFKVEDSPTGMASAISQVRVRAVDYRGEFTAGVRLNGLEIWSAPDDRINSRSAWFDFPTRPGGGAWTWDDIENMQVGVNSKRGSSGSGQGEVDQIYIRVEHALGAEDLKVNGTGDYTNIQNPGGVAAPFGYGVEADRQTGVLSGYAWSENIGWISFESSSVAGCPTNPCQAYVSFVDKKVYGWARACSVFQAGCSGALRANLGGWEGWVRFNGTNYAAELDDIPNPSEFFDWAWGDKKVIGWLSLNKSNTGGPVDYKVKTKLKLNNPPVASFVVQYPLGTTISPCTVASPCEVYLFETLHFINQSYDPDGNIHLTSSQWYFNRDSSGWVVDVSCTQPDGSGPALCDTSKGSPVGDYEVKLRVEDEKGGFNELTMGNIRIKQDIVASFQCSLDGVIWESDCSKINAAEEDTIYLKDTSIASEGASVNSWAWRVNGVDVGSAPQIDVPAEIPLMEIELTAMDTNGRQDTATQQIFGVMPLPQWREITPF